MEQSATLYLTGGTPAVPPFDLGLQPLDGRAVLIEDSCTHKGELHLPVSGRLQADTATVGASGIAEIAPGCRVGIMPGHGLYIDDWRSTGWNLRLVGVSVPWYESIPCRIIVKEGGETMLVPTYDWCLIRRAKRERAIFMPEISGWRDWESFGEVLAMGQEAGIARTRHGGRILVGGSPVKDRVVNNGDVVDFTSESMVTFRYGEDTSLCLMRYNCLMTRR